MATTYYRFEPSAVTTVAAGDLFEDYPDQRDAAEILSGSDPVLSMLTDLMEEVRSLRARLDELFPKAGTDG